MVLSMNHTPSLQVQSKHLQLLALCRAVEGRLGKPRKPLAIERSGSTEEKEERSAADDSGEQLVLALQSLQKQLNPDPEPRGDSPRSLHLGPVLAGMHYPTVDFALVAQGRKLLGGLAGGSSRKTRLEQEIRLATSKVEACRHSLEASV